MNIGIIIDGYSTGAGFAPVFKDFGIQCIHVQSSVQIPSVYKHTYNPDNYFKHYIYDNDLSELTAKLSNYRPRFVISGAECGVELADLICEELNLPGNGKELSACRRNKYLMQKRIEESGLKTIPSFLANNCSMAKDWASKQATWPVVIKPLKSAGGEDVLICNDAHDVVVGLNRILSRPHNMFGFKNHSAILQPYIQGQEYVINTVSYDGKHKLCEIWQYSLCLRDKFQIYDTASLVEYDETEHRGMIAYAFKVIDALGIKYGPAHVELIKNYAGCFVIEVGARLMGANLPFSFLSKCISTPQSMMTVLAYAAPDQFMLRINEPYRVLQTLNAIFMISNNSGTITKIIGIDKIQSLESFYDIKLVVSIGSKIFKTVDYQTSPGMVYLTHKDPVQVAVDKDKVRELEQTLFELQESERVE